ncbi:MAG: DUF4197 domain-containing protein [Fibrobacterota bacterium]|nr:DUF4197 domain-containing protein [Fibrobacterota bacterium]
MKKKTGWMAIMLGGALALGSCSLEDFLETSSSTSNMTLNEKVVLGLKTALEVGIDSSAEVASKVNGYLAHKVIKILLPEEAAQALKAAEEVGALVKPFATDLDAMQSVVNLTSGVDKNSFTSNLKASNALATDIAGLEGISDSVIKYMNRAAESAAPRSGPIFKSAITTMTIADGLTLLNSSDSTAATIYLNGKTFSPLVTAYTPIVDSTLALVPLTQYWGDFRTTYNAILSRYQSMVAFQQSWNSNVIVAAVPSLQVEKLKSVSYQPIVTESLGAWTTDKALLGLFHLVGEEEKEIRRDPLAYVRNLANDISGLLKEVFGEIMKMEP